MHCAGHPVAGLGWESCVIAQLVAAAPLGQASFCRTSHPAEVDLVLEIKRQSTPIDPKGFWIAANDVKASRNLLAAAVDSALAMRDEGDLMNRLLAAELMAMQPWLLARGCVAGSDPCVWLCTMASRSPSSSIQQAPYLL